MITKTLSTKEILDLTWSRRDDEIPAVEAHLILAGGAGRSSHSFTFSHETPTRKNRWFNHYMNICDCWELMSERAVLRMYPNAGWVLDE